MLRTLEEWRRERNARLTQEIIENQIDGIDIPGMMEYITSKEVQRFYQTAVDKTAALQAVFKHCLTLIAKGQASPQLLMRELSRQFEHLYGNVTIPNEDGSSDTLIIDTDAASEDNPYTGIQWDGSDIIVSGIDLMRGERRMVRLTNAYFVNVGEDAVDVATIFSVSYQYHPERIQEFANDLLNSTRLPGKESS